MQALGDAIGSSMAMTNSSSLGGRKGRKRWKISKRPFDIPEELGEMGELEENMRSLIFYLSSLMVSCLSHSLIFLSSLMKMCRCVARRKVRGSM